MTLIYELPAAVEVLCRDLSAGVLRRDPRARVIPGVSIERLERERRVLEAARKATARERRQQWQQLSAAMVAHTHQSARLPVPGNGFSAQKALLMGRQVRTHAGDPKPRQLQAYEPARVHLLGFMEVAHG